MVGGPPPRAVGLEERRQPRGLRRGPSRGLAARRAAARQPGLACRARCREPPGSRRQALERHRLVPNAPRPPDQPDHPAPGGGVGPQEGRDRASRHAAPVLATRRARRPRAAPSTTAAATSASATTTCAAVRACWARTARGPDPRARADERDQRPHATRPVRMIVRGARREEPGGQASPQRLGRVRGLPSRRPAGRAPRRASRRRHRA